MLRKNRDEPSEIVTPTYSAALYVRIRHRNVKRWLRENPPQPPEVKPIPANWVAYGALLLTVWATILANGVLLKNFIF